MPRFTHCAPMLRILPHLETLEDRSVPSVSPLDGLLLNNAPERPSRTEVEQTIDRIDNAARDWPALQNALDNLTTKQTINLATQLANVDTDTAGKVIKNLAENRPINSTPDVVSDDPVIDRPLREAKPAIVAPTRLEANLDTLRAASLNMDTAQESSANATRSGSFAFSTTPIATVLNAETTPDASVVFLAANVENEAASVNAPRGSTGGKAEVGALAVPLNFADEAISAAVTAEAVRALASADMMEATLPADSSALADFITHLNRVGESLGLPEGSGATAWIVAAALALAACELARRQIRAPRYSVSLSPDDASDTLSWSLSMR